jgi:hypothetical protein
MHILVQKASWKIDEDSQALHNKEQRSFSSSTWQEKEKFHELCTTRNNNRKTL